MAQASNNKTAQRDTEHNDTETAEPSLASHLLKDAVVIFAALSVWAAADTWYETTQLGLAQMIAVGDAIIVGIILSTLAHEWGHYVGAITSGAKVTRFYPNHVTFLRFNFEFAENDVKQFHQMTYGGHIMHWLVLVLLIVALPLDTLQRITLVAAYFGFVAFSTHLEYNIVKDTWAGADPATRLNALTNNDIKQSAVVGTLAGMLAIAVLS
jgi:hypothetical protein